MHLQLSWRNIWRNPKRTLIILTAVVIGAWTMLVFSGFSRGMAKSTLDNALDTLTGHIQIQAPAFRDDPVAEHRIKDPEAVAKVLDTRLPRGAKWTFRVQVGGVASNARHSKGITIVGIDPDREPGLSFYGKGMVRGRRLTPEDKNGIVVGRALAGTFHTGLGKKLVLMAQGADRETASMAFRIKGIFQAEMEATENQYIFITLKSAQKLLGIGAEVTNACIKLPHLNPNQDQARLDRVTHALAGALPRDLEALAWPRLLPLLKGYLNVFDSFMFLWYLVGFTAMAFGLVNTMLMAVLERTREFGLLKALGMQPVRIVTNVLLECLILLGIGLTAGNLLGLATVAALSCGIDLSFLAQGSEFIGMGKQVIPFLTPKDYISVNGVILMLGLLVCLYPAVKAGRIPPAEAMARA